MLKGGVNKDYNEASAWLHKAVEQENSKAQLVLASMYIKGQGVTQDHTIVMVSYSRIRRSGLKLAIAIKEY